MSQFRPVLRARIGQLHQLVRTYLDVVAHPVDVVQALRDPDVVRVFPSWARDHRRAAVQGTAGLVTASVVLPRVAPRLVRPALVGVAAAVAHRRWQGSAARARLHRWPPGPRVTSPRALASAEVLDERARRHGPVFGANHLGEPMACVVGTARGVDLLRDNPGRVARWTFPYFALVPGGFVREKDGPEHKQDRAMIAAALPPAFVDECAPLLRAAFDSMLRDLSVESEIAGAVPPAEHIDRAVFRAWQRVFFGPELTAEDLADLSDRYLVARFLGPGRPTATDAEAALHAIETKVRSVLQPALERGSAPACAVTEVLRRHPGALDDPHVLRTLIYVCTTSQRDTAGLVTWIFKKLCDAPAWVEALRTRVAAGESFGPGTLADHIVTETLRLAQSEYLRLRVTDDIRYEGHVIPRGWILRLCVAQNHRDPAVFDDPDAFRPDRWAARNFGRREFAPFGMDSHFCLGEPLARATGRAFVRALAGYDVAVVADGPPEYTDRYHAAPSSRLRVAVSPHAGAPACHG